MKKSWVQGLPKVKGRYGCPTVEEWDSFVSVRKSGCTDEQFMQQIIEEVYLLLYPNIHPTTERDESGKFLRGPIIIKTDSGQGRLNASFKSIAFYEKMGSMDVHIVLGLPNSTSCTQELDQVYQEFKTKTRERTNQLFGEKQFNRSRLISDLKIELDLLGFKGASNGFNTEREESDDNDDVVNLEIDKEEASDSAEAIVVDTDDNQEVTEEMRVVLEKLKDTMKQPTLSNDDLPVIVNGTDSDDFKNKPFDSTFTKDKVLKYFRRVVYVPFTRECLKSKYIRHELNEDTDNEALATLVTEYEEAKLNLKQDGFNVEGVFDALVTTATCLHCKDTGEEQVQAHVSRRAGFYASAIYTNIGTMCITAGAVLKAQSIQLQN